MSKIGDHMVNQIEDIDFFARGSIGVETLERYTGSKMLEFQPYIILTNFSKYADHFAQECKVEKKQGSIMSASHAPEQQITLIHFGIGSPLAALIIELLSFIKPRAVLFLGLCGGLRSTYNIGDYFNPVAAIRGEGTSDFFLPKECPSLSSFIIQRFVCEEIEKNNLQYHSGVIHTTNIRFWEFKEEFKQLLVKQQVQAIDMECATLFTVGFAYRIAVGALLLISDLPMHRKIKTLEIHKEVFENHIPVQVRMGINILKSMRETDSYTKYQF